MNMFNWSVSVPAVHIVMHLNRYGVQPLLLLLTVQNVRVSRSATWFRLNKPRCHRPHCDGNARLLNVNWHSLNGAVAVTRFPHCTHCSPTYLRSVDKVKRDEQRGEVSAGTSGLWGKWYGPVWPTGSAFFRRTSSFRFRLVTPPVLAQTGWWWD